MELGAQYPYNASGAVGSRGRIAGMIVVGGPQDVSMSDPAVAQLAATSADAELEELCNALPGWHQQQLAQVPGLLGGLSRTVSAPSAFLLSASRNSLSTGFQVQGGGLTCLSTSPLQENYPVTFPTLDEGVSVRSQPPSNARWQHQGHAVANGPAQQPQYNNKQAVPGRPPIVVGSEGRPWGGLAGPAPPWSTLLPPGEQHTSAMLLSLYPDQFEFYDAAAAEQGNFPVPINGTGRLRLSSQAPPRIPQQLSPPTSATGLSDWAPGGHQGGGSSGLHASGAGALSGPFFSPSSSDQPGAGPGSDPGSGALPPGPNVAHVHINFPLLAHLQLQQQQANQRALFSSPQQEQQQQQANQRALSSSPQQQQQANQRALSSSPQQQHLIMGPWALTGNGTAMVTAPCRPPNDDMEAATEADADVDTDAEAELEAEEGAMLDMEHDGAGGVSGDQSASSGSSMCAAINGALVAAAECDAAGPGLGPDGGALAGQLDAVDLLDPRGSRSMNAAAAGDHGDGEGAAGGGAGGNSTPAATTDRTSGGGSGGGGGRLGGAAAGSRSSSGAAALGPDGPVSEDGLQLLAMRFRNRPGRVPKAVAKLGPIAELAKSAATGKIKLGKGELEDLVMTVETSLARAVTEQKEDSRARNRVAQQRFRNRQRETITALQTKVEEQEALIAALQDKIQMYEAQQPRLHPCHDGAHPQGAGDVRSRAVQRSGSE